MHDRNAYGGAQALGKEASFNGALAARGGEIEVPKKEEYAGKR